MSNYSSDAAEQVMRISLEGTEVALKLVGSGAKQLGVLLFAALNGQKKSRGKTRLMSLLKSGKELKVFALKDSEMDLFRKEAKKYGILFTMLKDNTVNDGITDIMVKAEDASRVNYIFERFKLATVDMGSVLQDVDRSIDEKNLAEGEKKILTNDEKTDAYLDKVLAGSGEAQKANPTRARDGEPDPQSMNSKAQKPKQEEAARDTTVKRPVKEELEEIKTEMAKKEKSAAKTKTRSRAKQTKVKGAR